MPETFSSNTGSENNRLYTSDQNLEPESTFETFGAFEHFCNCDMMDYEAECTRIGCEILKIEQMAAELGCN